MISDILHKNRSRALGTVTKSRAPEGCIGERSRARWRTPLALPARSLSTGHYGARAHEVLVDGVGVVGLVRDGERFPLRGLEDHTPLVLPHTVNIHSCNSICVVRLSLSNGGARAGKTGSELGQS